MRIVIFVAAVLFPALASPQSIEVFATSGVVQLWDDEGNLGAGIPIGAGVGFRSPHGWGVEAVVERQNANRNFDSGVRFASTVTAARARVIKYFGAGPTHVYAGGSLGAAHVASTRESPAGCALINNVFTCAGKDTFTTASTSGTLGGFAGVRIAAGRMFVRPEFEVSRAGEHMRIGGTVAVGASW